MNVSFDFDGDVALVTGASGALGSATTEAFRNAGATVAAVDVRPPDHADSLLDPDSGTTFYEADLTDEPDVERVVAAVVEEHGRLDHVVNVAGTWRGGDPLHETDNDLFDFLFDVNLKTMFLTSKHAIPHLREVD